MTTTLLPCPFCGELASSGEALSENDGRYYVQTGCSACGALGPRVEVQKPEPRQLNDSLRQVNDWAKGIRISTPAADAAWNCRKALH